MQVVPVFNRIVCLLAACVAATAMAAPALTTEGSWAEQRNLIWTGDAGALQTVRVWDNAPELRRRFVWQGSLNDAGQAHGNGTLEWRQSGSADYGSRGLLSVYHGQMHNGRHHGQGTLRLANGEMYNGEWLDGKRHGRGRGWYADGAYYEGGFAADRWHGEGRLAAADGREVRGRFEYGQSLDGVALRDVAMPRPAVADTGAAQAAEPTVAIRVAAAGADPVTVSVSSNARISEEFRRENYESGFDAIIYRSVASSGQVRIEPEFERWQVWKSGGILSGTTFEPGIGPVFLLVALDNAQPGSMVIERGYVEVASSTPDLSPYIDFSHYLEPSFTLSNVGWGAARHCVFEFNLLRPDERPPGNYRFKKPLGVLDEQMTVDLTPELRQMGVRMDFIKQHMYELPDYVNRQNARSILGPFAVFDRNGELESARVEYKGRLSYEWRDADGIHRGSVQLHGEVELYNLAEYGASAPVNASYDVALNLEGQDYRVPFAFQQALEVGRNASFGLRVSASRSSRHRFRVVLQTTAGNRWRSPPVDLHLFMPRMKIFEEGIRPPD